ncbi:uncharacterized protein LOC9652834 [Selaginella moellendorffii]|uniref:uncharacterized protein LOC9652834 n=1 Tax=Selaginella moellendorffii TaxID=88036 RepID=UPI000D1C6BC6|nr:uncharacterized protein LOC9652834 [Selaginella moellendorffii]|eukprot:XP_024522683.1 uncharacterized protein LOC9652834 [Selaginella moellendorffii]
MADFQSEVPAPFYARKFQNGPVVEAWRRFWPRGRWNQAAGKGYRCVLEAGSRDSVYWRRCAARGCNWNLHLRRGIHPADGSQEWPGRWQLQRRSHHRSRRRRNTNTKLGRDEPQAARGIAAAGRRVPPGVLQGRGSYPRLPQPGKGSSRRYPGKWFYRVGRQDDEELDATNRCGMVTLVRPDGTCVTSYACMKKKAEEESDGKRYVVCVDGRRYECVSEVAGGVGVLTPAQGCSQSFSACAVVAPMPGPWLTVVSASWDHDGNKKPLLVAGTSVGGDGGRFEDLLEYETSCQFPPYRHIMLSCDGAKIECGAPVMTPRGSLTGVVVGFGKLRNDKRRSKKLKPPYNFPITKGDFGRFFKGVPESIAEDCRAGVEVNCMYYNTVEGKIGFPAIEWRHKNYFKADGTIVRLSCLEHRDRILRPRGIGRRAR